LTVGDQIVRSIEFADMREETDSGSQYESVVWSLIYRDENRAPGSRNLALHGLGKCQVHPGNRVIGQ
jgi:hypothetical protein